MSMPIIKSSNIHRKDAVTDIIESVALEQTSLSHILNAEGEKIQAALEIATDNDELIKINDSAQSMVNAVTRLETILQGKVELFNDCLCVPCVPSTLTFTLSNPTGGTIVETATNVYTYTGSDEANNITFVTNPEVDVTSTSVLPQGITFINNVLSIPEDFDYSESHTLLFMIGTDACKYQVSIIIAQLCTPSTLTFTLSNPTGGSIIETANNIYAYIGNEQANNITFVTNPAVTITQISLPVGVTFAANVLSIPANYAYPEENEALFWIGTDLCKYLVRIIITEECVPSTLTFTLSNPTGGSIAETATNEYTYTGSAEANNITFVTNPAVTVTSTSVLPTGITFAGNVLSIPADFSYSEPYTLLFMVGTDLCQYQVRIIIAQLCTPSTLTFTVSNPTGGTIIETGNKEYLYSGNAQANNITFVTNPAVTVTQISLPVGVTFAANVLSIPANYAYPEANEALFLVGTDLCQYQVSIIIAEECYPSDLVLTLYNPSWGSISKTGNHEYSYTGTNETNVINFVTDPAVDVASLSVLPTGFSFADNALIIPANFSYSEEYTLLFMVGTDLCKYQVSIIIKECVSITYTLTVSDLENGYVLNDSLNFWKFYGNYRSNSITITTNPAFVITHYTLPHDITFSNNVVHIPANYDYLAPKTAIFWIGFGSCEYQLRIDFYKIIDP